MHKQIKDYVTKLVFALINEQFQLLELTKPNSKNSQKRLAKRRRKKEKRKEEVFYCSVPSVVPNLIIDLHFIHYFDCWHLKKLNRQLSYIVEKFSSKKWKISISINAPFLYDFSYIANSSGGNILVFENRMHYFYKFPISELIYLTADAEEELTDEQNKVFVIGGFIDRNAKKNLTYDFAKAWGVTTRKLPLVRFGFCEAVLTTSQVAEIMHYFLEFGDMKKALAKHFPKRKMKGNISES